jgi:hypothetical protein
LLVKSKVNQKLAFIKAGVFKIKAKVNNDFYEMGEFSGVNWHRKIGTFFHKPILGNICWLIKILD